jgi:hypothetical protein
MLSQSIVIPRGALTPANLRTVLACPRVHVLPLDNATDTINGTSAFNINLIPSMRTLCNYSLPTSLSVFRQSLINATQLRGLESFNNSNTTQAFFANLTKIQEILSGMQNEYTYNNASAMECGAGHGWGCVSALINIYFGHAGFLRGVNSNGVRANAYVPTIPSPLPWNGLNAFGYMSALIAAQKNYPGTNKLWSDVIATDFFMQQVAKCGDVSYLSPLAWIDPSRMYAAVSPGYYPRDTSSAIFEFMVRGNVFEARGDVSSCDPDADPAISLYFPNDRFDLVAYSELGVDYAQCYFPFEANSGSVYSATMNEPAAFPTSAGQVYWSPGVLPATPTCSQRDTMVYTYPYMLKYPLIMKMIIHAFVHLMFSDVLWDLIATTTRQCSTTDATIESIVMATMECNNISTMLYNGDANSDIYPSIDICASPPITMTTNPHMSPLCALLYAAMQKSVCDPSQSFISGRWGASENITMNMINEICTVQDSHMPFNYTADFQIGLPDTSCSTGTRCYGYPAPVDITEISKGLLACFYRTISLQGNYETDFQFDGLCNSFVQEAVIPDTPSAYSTECLMENDIPRTILSSRASAIDISLFDTPQSFISNSDTVIQCQ